MNKKPLSVKELGFAFWYGTNPLDVEYGFESSEINLT